MVSQLQGGIKKHRYIGTMRHWKHWNIMWNLQLEKHNSNVKWQLELVNTRWEPGRWRECKWWQRGGWRCGRWPPRWRTSRPSCRTSRPSPPATWFDLSWTIQVETWTCYKCKDLVWTFVLIFDTTSSSASLLDITLLANATTFISFTFHNKFTLVRYHH